MSRILTSAAVMIGALRVKERIGSQRQARNGKENIVIFPLCMSNFIMHVRKCVTGATPM